MYSLTSGPGDLVPHDGRRGGTINCDPIIRATCLATNVVQYPIIRHRDVIHWPRFVHKQNGRIVMGAEDKSLNGHVGTVRDPESDTIIVEKHSRVGVAGTTWSVRPSSPANEKRASGIVAIRVNFR